MNAPGLKVEDCWSEGGKLRLEVHEGGQRIRMAGNAEGMVGLARVLLYLAHNGLDEGKVVSLEAFDAFGAGDPTLELGPPT